MTPPAREWIAKAEGDFDSALREYRARKKPNYDSACFHAQQCVEKYMKAVLQASNVHFPKTHDLSKLLDLCVKSHPMLEAYRAETGTLTQYAVLFRYPGENATRHEAKEAVDTATRLREKLRKALKR